MSPFIFLLLFISTKTKASDLNVGTTLFTKADKCKACWSSENLALLTSRMILEDLLPSTSILVIDSNEFVTDLVEYFRMILEIVRHETHGKTKHITLLALTDLLGGYLHHAVLPIAKYAYYAGLIDYDSMATLLGLFDELKRFLRTNGQGWSNPLSRNLENLEIQRIPLQSPIDKELCQNLMFVEGDQGEKLGDQCDATLPIPFFDSVTLPSAIALPTKTCPLHSVEANSSSFLVMKFFVTSYKCLQQKNVKNENLKKFQNDFCSWIEEQIIPRLADDKFYAAFGGILRVRSTLRRLGVSQNNVEKQIEEFRNNGAEPEEQVQHRMSRSSMILTAVLITIFVWFILGSMFVCYKMRQTKQQACSPEGGDGTTVCSSLTSSKYFYPEKLKPSRDKRGTSTPDSETSDLDISNYHKRRIEKKHYPLDSLHYHKFNWSRDQGQPQRTQHHEINIKTCLCKPNEDDDEDTLTGVSGTIADSSHTEGRLASITEISENSTGDRRTNTTSRNKRSPGASATSESQDNKHSKVEKRVYMDSESETEETSEPR